ncbi:MAG: hypothetical protein SFW36_05665 [Leptolyngbyaceae cyanobacterium bins.59]|nr:hypothetical protein [Leptolyngbyaceae cyanobacterium bins.59]
MQNRPVRASSVLVRFRPFVMPLSVFCLIGLLPLVAIACGPGMFREWVFGSQLITLPLGLGFSLYGLPLLAIVPTEAFILHRREDLRYSRALGLTLIANMFYSIAAMVSTTSFPVLGGLISGAMSVRAYPRTGVFKHLPQWAYVLMTYVVFVGIDVSSFALREGLRKSTESVVVYGITAGLLLISFIFSWVVKGFTIRLFLKEKRSGLAGSLFSMQVGTFAILAVTAIVLAALQSPKSGMLPEFVLPFAR